MAKPSTSFSISGINIDIPMILAFMRRRRFFAISIISWVVMALLAVAVLVPQVQQILTRRQEIERVQADLNKDQAFVDSLQALNDSDLKQANTVLSATLPQEKPVLPLLYSLNRLASSAQVAVSEFEVSPGLLGTGSGKLDNSRSSSTIDPQLAALPLRMSVAGSFENLSTFFKSLDAVLPLVQITEVQFSSQQRSLTAGATPATNSAQYSAKVELSTLYMKTKPTIGTEETIANLSANDTTLLDTLTASYAQWQTDNAQQLTEASASGRTNLFAVPQQ